MSATTICRDCRVISPAQFVVNERCPICACKYLRQERRKQRTPESRLAILTEVYARLKVQADRYGYYGYRQIHHDDVEELLAEIERLSVIEKAARRFVSTMSNDCASEVDAQNEYDALNGALSESSDG